MLEKLRKERGDEGFTLIELLVVIIIIGILAAIAIPVFLNQRKKGWDAAVKSDLKNMATAQETYNTEHFTYTLDDTKLTDPAIGFKYSNDSNYTTPSALITIKGYDGAGGAATTDPTMVGGFCLQATSASSAVWVYDSLAGGLQDPNTGKTAC
jgi:type IV pilus assembly protein PilA